MSHDESAHAASGSQHRSRLVPVCQQVVGNPHEVVERLVDIKAKAEADELVLVKPWAGSLPADRELSGDRR